MAGIPVQVSFDATTMAKLTGVNNSLASLATSAKTGVEALIAIDASLSSMASIESKIEVSLDSVAKSLAAPPPPVPVKISLALPTRTKKGIPMPNFELPNDEVVTIPILVDDSSGDPVPAPAGDTFSVTSSSPSLNAIIGATAAGNPAVVINATVKASPGLSFTVSDSAGLTSFTQMVDIVPDTTPSAITLDLADATEVSQPVPTAPGP